MVDIDLVAVIPARGGSKRLPRKNIIDFFGKPMLAWTIEAAQQSGLFKRILVSTDDAEVAAVAEKYGVEVPFLREDCFDDHAPVSAATIHSLQQARRHFEEEYDGVAQLMPNCPLRRAGQIVEAVEMFSKTQRQFQISCFKFGWMNPWWACKLDDMMQPEALFPAEMAKRSQDLPQLYCPTGAIWLASYAGLMAQGTFYGPGYTFFPMDWQAAVDIDDAEDLRWAKALYHLMS